MTNDEKILRRLIRDYESKVQRMIQAGLIQNAIREYQLIEAARAALRERFKL